MSQHSPTRLVHIFGQTPHHYQPMRAFFTHAMADADIEQVFWAWALPKQDEQEGFSFYKDGKRLLAQMNQQPGHTVFVFHGMFERQIWPYLVFSPLTRRSCWVCWGAELYQHKNTGLPLKRRIMNIAHRLLSRRLAQVFTLNDGDGQLVKSILGTQRVSTLPYPLIGVDNVEVTSASRKQVTVLLGNSAAASNEHLVCLEWLSKFADEDIEVIAPLNYGGDAAYVTEVIAEGKTLLGDKFKPLTDMMSKKDYDQLLLDVDCAVFGHQRQQGLYVVYSMLKHGKKMFVRGDTSTFDSMAASGFTLYKSEAISQHSFDTFKQTDEQALAHNRQLMEQTFSEQALAPRWRRAIEDLISSVR